MRNLNNTKKRIIQLKINGKQDKVIADELCKSIETIKYHWKQMQVLFGVQTTLQVCVMAVSAGYAHEPAANDDVYERRKLRA